MKQISERFNVSRETVERLGIFEDLLRKWNPRINLVSKDTLIDGLERHFVDSLQLWQYRGATTHWVDLGSGGGFPGMVLAIAAAESGSPHFTLIESDQRKCAFLRAVSRETSVPVTIRSVRIEIAEPENADTCSARALAPLGKLLELSTRHLKDGGIHLYPKGKSWEEEVETARRLWEFEMTAFPSQTNSDAVILKIWNVVRA